MKGCLVCEKEGVIRCLKGCKLEDFTKKQLIEIIEDIIETKNKGGKL